MRSTEDLIIAAVLPKPRLGGNGVFSLLDTVLRQNFDESYFQGVHRHLFKASVAANVLALPLDDESLNALLDQHQVPEKDRLECLITFKDLSSIEVTPEKLKVLLPTFRDTVHTDRFGNILQQSAEILTTENGQEKGFKAARSFIITEMAKLDQKETRALPSKDIRATAEEIREEYDLAKKGSAPGIMTGFRNIDRLTNGFRVGELSMMCAYTGEGKTQFLLNVGYHAAVHQQKRVVFVSLEMPLAQVRKRIISRHTNHPKFGLPGGLDYSKIKNGTLDPNEEEVFFQILKDWETNPQYGLFQVTQMSKYDTVSVLAEKLMYQRSRGPIDAVVLDYASLLSSQRRRNERRDETVEVVEALKSLALSFNEGEGLCIISANQINRKAREEAEQLGKYGFNFASETSAIEKTADFLGWLLRTDALKNSREIEMGIAKYRDGDVGTSFRLMEHYESSLMADVTTF